MTAPTKSPTVEIDRRVWRMVLLLLLSNLLDDLSQRSELNFLAVFAATAKIVAVLYGVGYFATDLLGGKR